MELRSEIWQDGGNRKAGHHWSWDDENGTLRRQPYFRRSGPSAGYAGESGPVPTVSVIDFGLSREVMANLRCLQLGRHVHSLGLEREDPTNSAREGIR